MHSSIYCAEGRVCEFRGEYRLQGSKRKGNIEFVCTQAFKLFKEYEQRLDDPVCVNSLRIGGERGGKRIPRRLEEKAELNIDVICATN